MNPKLQTAIDESCTLNNIVTLHIEDRTDSLVDDLVVESDDHVWTKGNYGTDLLEAWGEDNGCSWRVHLQCAN